MNVFDAWYENLLTARMEPSEVAEAAWDACLQHVTKLIQTDIDALKGKCLYHADLFLAGMLKNIQEKLSR